MLINKTIVSDGEGNELRLSSVYEFENSINFYNFSAKYVVDGEENYTINQKKYNIKKGEYVVGNQNTFASILIDSIKPVQGICVDISEEKINEVINYSFSKNDSFLNFLSNEELILNKYNSGNTKLGVALTTIANQFDSLLQTPSLANNELFYSIAECIVIDQSRIYKQYTNLQCSKEITSKRLFQFVYAAKDFIDSNFQDKINSKQMAGYANLSEYHFIRLFKSVFNQTPYQYLLFKRLEYSKLLLLDKCPTKEVAYQTGFADVQAFSKAFKANFGTTPTVFKNSN